MSETTFTNAGADTVFSRMRPTTLVAFISDMDDMSPEDYTDEDMRILHAAVIELCQVVGVPDAIAMLSAADVHASNPVIGAAFSSPAIRTELDALFDEVTQ